MVNFLDVVAKYDNYNIALSVNSLCKSSNIILNPEYFLKLIGVNALNDDLTLLVEKYISDSVRNYKLYKNVLRREFKLIEKELPEQDAIECLKALMNNFNQVLSRKIYFITGRAAAGKSYIGDKLKALIQDMEILNGDGYLLSTRQERALFEDNPLRKFKFSLFKSHIEQLAYTQKSVPKLTYRGWDGQVVDDGCIGNNPDTNILVDSVFFGNLNQYEELLKICIASVFIATEDIIALFNRIWRDLKMRNAPFETVIQKIQNDYIRLKKQHIPISWQYLEKSQIVLFCALSKVTEGVYPLQFTYSLYLKR